MADSTSNIPPIEANSQSKEAQANALFDAASQAMTYGRNAATSSGLTWGFLGGNVVVADGSRVRVENGTLTLTASQTNYIVAAKADGAVSFATTTTNWDNTDDYWRLYSVVTGSATVTSWVDHRCPGQYQGAGSGGGGGTVDTIAAGDGIIVDATDPANPEVSSDFGSTAGTVCEGDDSRLSDARDWIDYPLTTAEDLLVGGTSGAPNRLPVGTEGQVLTVSSGVVAWANPSSGFANPMTTAGDLIYGGTGGAAQRLAVGTEGHVLKVVSGNPAWAAESGAAANISYDNTTSGLAATQVQAAIDEIADEAAFVNASNTFAETQTFTRIQETVTTVTGTTPSLGAGDATIFTWSLSGASTPTSGLADGESCTLLITPTTHSISWTNFNVGDAGAPPLTNGKVTVVVLYRVGATSFVDFVRQH